MPTVKGSLTVTYYPSPSDAIGFEATFVVFDNDNQGGAGDYLTTITISPQNATYFSLNEYHSCGTRAHNGAVTKGADIYDTAGITASWTGPVPTQQAQARTYYLRGRFNAPAGIIQVSADSMELADPGNTASGNPESVTSRTVMIPSQQ